MTFNLPLGVDVLAHIENDPTSWRQDKWGIRTECGTARCYAGWALALSGQKFEWDEMESAISYAYEVVGHGSIPSTAEGILGMKVGSYGVACNATERQHLFLSSNTLDDLYRITAELAKVDEGELRVVVKDRVVEIESP